MSLSSAELEDLADNLLRSEFEDSRKNKIKLKEYPILSPSQIKRRFLNEIPYSNLSERQRIECSVTKNYDYYHRKEDK